MNYHLKYLKYKTKYLNLKKLIGGITYTIPLELLDNEIFNEIFNKSTHIDKSKITKITYERKIQQLTYEKYDEKTNTYQKVVSDKRINQFIFNVFVNYSETPIIIACDDSRKKNYSNIYSYRWIPALSTDTTDRILWNFIVNGSINSYSYYLERFGQLLGHLVNNNIVLLQEKILTYDECPINLTKYDELDEIVLLYPCLHTVSNNAYTTANITKCPICREEIDDTQLLSFDEFNKIYLNE
jgi:hypothetical protein